MQKVFKKVALLRADEPDVCGVVRTTKELEKLCLNTVFPIPVMDMPVNSEYDVVLEECIGVCGKFVIIDKILYCDVFLMIDEERVAELEDEHKDELLFLTPVFETDETGDTTIVGVWFGNYVEMLMEPVNYMLEELKSLKAGKVDNNA